VTPAREHRVDFVVRGGVLVTPNGEVAADIAVGDGRIVGIGIDLAPAASADIDATGLHVLPGVVDAHVHFNDPGRADWEGWPTGSAALAGGGGTVAVDMPLNSDPPLLDGVAFDAKVTAASGRSWVDFALWGGLTPDNLDRLPELAERGVVGFKAFMSNSGIPGFRATDEPTLRRGMIEAARLELPVAVHAEDESICAELAAAAIAAGHLGWRDWAASRPVRAEVAAIGRALSLAAETGCSLHVVHVSSADGVALVAQARRRGIDVTCETCPHYLVLDDDDLAAIGATAKCAPPLRPAAHREALWSALAAGEIQTVGSDHSPAPPSIKTGADAFAVWGGIAGCQTTLPLLLTEGVHARGVPVPMLASALADTPARRLRLGGKGRLAIGFDADLTLVDLEAEWTLSASDLRYRHPLSPFLGRVLRGKVVRTLLRGETVFRDGAAVGRPSGRLLHPSIGNPNGSRAASTIGV
jgi:allantoinase